jgi:hypothetical protein
MYFVTHDLKQSCAVEKASLNKLNSKTYITDIMKKKMTMMMMMMMMMMITVVG